MWMSHNIYYSNLNFYCCCDFKRPIHSISKIRRIYIAEEYGTKSKTIQTNLEALRAAIRPTTDDARLDCSNEFGSEAVWYAPTITSNKYTIRSIQIELGKIITCFILNMAYSWDNRVDFVVRYMYGKWNSMCFVCFSANGDFPVNTAKKNNIASTLCKYWLDWMSTFPYNSHWLNVEQKSKQSWMWYNCIEYWCCTSKAANK